MATKYLFYECDEISQEDKTFAILFLLRNLIELGLKRMFHKTIEHGVPRKIFLSKRRSHLLYKELWKNVRPMIEYYSKAQGQDLEIIDIVEKQIQELGNIDKNGDVFRYPTSYSLEYRFDNIDIDLKNVYEYMQGIFNFCDGCDGEFEAVAECMTGTQMDRIFHECGVRDTSNESTKWKRIFYTFQARQEVDGSSLFNTAFSVNNPRLALNSLRTSTERNLQNGLKEMLNGVTHMVQNVTAHELKVKWVVNEQDAIDILTTISFLHKQLDECFVVPQHII